MKRTTIFSFMAAITLSFMACDDISEVEQAHSRIEPASTGAPVVENISLASDTSETRIEQAAFKDVVKFSGKNLGGVTAVKINDVDVELKEIYNSYSAILLTIPKKLPTEITNTVSITTRNGHVKVPLEVTVPKLIISGLTNEFAQPGDTTVIEGDNFDIYNLTPEEADIRVGDKYVSVLNATDRIITIQIPGNADFGTPLSIKSNYMETPVYVPYGEAGSQVFDMDNWPGEGCYTHANKYPELQPNFLYDAATITDDMPKMLGNMKYIYFRGDVGAWGWMVLWAGSINILAEVAANPADYDFSFEMNNNENYPYNSAVRMVFQDYVWEPAKNGVPLNTRGSWKTIRINAGTDDGQGHKLIPDGTDPQYKMSFSIVFSPSSEQHFDVAFCNFRFIKKH